MCKGACEKPSKCQGRTCCLLPYNFIISHCDGLHIVLSVIFAWIAIVALVTSQVLAAQLQHLPIFYLLIRVIIFKGFVATQGVGQKTFPAYIGASSLYKAFTVYK
jgi:hypothetical protein